MIRYYDYDLDYHLQLLGKNVQISSWVEQEFSRILDPTFDQA